MRTPNECLAKAAEMEERASTCAPGTSRVEYLALAKMWRGMAEPASFGATFDVIVEGTSKTQH